MRVMNKERNGRKYYKFFCLLHSFITTSSHTVFCINYFSLSPHCLAKVYFSFFLFLRVRAAPPSPLDPRLPPSVSSWCLGIQRGGGADKVRVCLHAGFVLHRRQDHHRLPPLSWDVSWAVAVSGVVTHTGCCWSSEVLAEIKEIVT